MIVAVQEQHFKFNGRATDDWENGTLLSQSESEMTRVGAHNPVMIGVLRRHGVENVLLLCTRLPKSRTLSSEH